MAFIKSSKSSITGLVDNLSALASADATELNRATAAELVLRTDLASETTAARAAELVLRTDLASEVVRALAAEAALLQNIADEATARGVAISAETALRVADVANLQSQVSNIISNTNPAAIDSFTEALASWQAMDGDLSASIATLSTSAASALAAEIARATAAELVLTNDLIAETARAAAAELLLTNNLAAEVTARGTDEAAQTVMLKAYTDEAVRVGGAVDALESVIVNSNKIVLVNAPKSGVASIKPWGRVSFVNELNEELQVPVSLDSSDTTGKTFIVSVEISGELDTKSVLVQYSYVAG
jgi:hypothetical protein